MQNLKKRIDELLEDYGKPKNPEVSLVIINEENKLIENIPKDAVIITDEWVNKNLIQTIGLKNKIFEIVNEDVGEAKRVIQKLPRNVETIVGFGGGRPSDIAKYVANSINCTLVVVPTAPSNDGISSGVSALIVDGKKTTVRTKRPDKVVVYKKFWEKVPAFFIQAGVCDVLGKITSLQDTSLAVLNGENVEKESILYGLLALKMILGSEYGNLEALGSSLVLSGESMKKTSRVASGSEHEVEKLLTKNGIQGTHGQLVGLGTLISAKIYQENSLELPGLFFDSSDLFDTTLEIFRKFRILDFVLEPLRRDREKIAKLMETVSNVRPERYTIWNKIKSKTIDWGSVLESIERI
jgi:glycerol-1-phosphate dehydrogenase [NAD(P)+]